MTLIRRATQIQLDANDQKLWQSLRVGDRIRMVEYPQEFQEAGHFIHPETRRVYKRLLARGRPLRVYKLDDWGLPWVRCQFRQKNGRIEYHYLAINHDGLVRVKQRVKQLRRHK